MKCQRSTYGTDVPYNRQQCISVASQMEIESRKSDYGPNVFDINIIEQALIDSQNIIKVKIT